MKADHVVKHSVYGWIQRGDSAFSNSASRQMETSMYSSTSRNDINVSNNKFRNLIYYFCFHLNKKQEEENDSLKRKKKILGWSLYASMGVNFLTLTALMVELGYYLTMSGGNFKNILSFKFYFLTIIQCLT